MSLASTKKIKIKVTVQFEGPYWSAIFERTDKKAQAIVRQIFATEPSDQELYDFVSHYFYELKFKESVGALMLDIHRQKSQAKALPKPRRPTKKLPGKKPKASKSIRQKRQIKKKHPSKKKVRKAKQSKA